MICMYLPSGTAAATSSIFSIVMSETGVKVGLSLSLLSFSSLGGKTELSRG